MPNSSALSLPALAALLAMAWIPSGWAYDCPAFIRPSTSRAPAYGPSPDGAHCEGFFDRTVSQPFVELVSMTQGPGLKADAAPGPLVLQTAVRKTLRLLIQPVRSVPYYRVDADLPGGAAWTWNPAPMLSAARLSAVDLGFLALATLQGPTGSTAVAPVALSTSAKDIPEATAIVRASVDIGTLVWRTYRIGSGTPPTEWTVVPGFRRYAWQRNEIAIPLPSDGKAMAVDVKATDAVTDKPLPILRLTVLGPRDE